MHLFLWVFLCLAGAAQPGNAPMTETQIAADDSLIRYTGRFEVSDPRSVRFAWSGSGIRFRCEAPAFSVRLGNVAEGEWAEGGSYYTIIADGGAPVTLKVSSGVQAYAIQLSPERSVHDIEIFRRSEAFTGIGVFQGLTFPSGGKLLPLPAAPLRRIEFIGNSITCGYGNEGLSADCHFSPETENGYLAYGALTARSLEAEYRAVCYSGRGIYQNYDRSRSGTMRELFQLYYPQDRLRWDFRTPAPDLVLINLGTNDFAHENPSETAFVAAYTGLLSDIRSRYPEARIICLTGSMLTDNEARKPLSTLKRYLGKAIAARNAAGDSQISRFDLSPQGALGYGCDWHPNLAQHELNAGELTVYIRMSMGW